MRKIVVLGSTGSIGVQTLDVARRHPDKLRVVALAVNSSVDELLRQARAFGVRALAVGNASLAEDARFDGMRKAAGDGMVGAFDEAVSKCAGNNGTSAPSSPELTTVGFGSEAVAALARLAEADVVVNALVGEAGLRASYETLRAGKVLALANKESLVVGGDLIMPLAAQVDEARRAAGKAPAHGPAGALMPIDSEHGAIYQCLIGESEREVSRLWVTASGGPFRGRTRAELTDITPAQALEIGRAHV